MRIFRQHTWDRLQVEREATLLAIEKDAYERGLADGRANVLRTEREEFIRVLRTLFLGSCADASLATNLLKVYDIPDPGNGYAVSTTDTLRFTRRSL